MKGIDFKSAVIGLLFGVCVMFVLGAGASDIADVGRYQVSAAGDSGSACYVIDSATGRTWRRYSNTQGSYIGSPEAWDEKARKK